MLQLADRLQGLFVEWLKNMHPEFNPGA